MKNGPTLRLLDRMTKEERLLVKAFANRHEIIGKVGEKMRETVAILSERGWSEHLSIWNSCLFLNVVTYDLSHLVYDVIYERDNWRRKLAARNLSTLVFEIGEDLPTVFGKDFRAACSNLSVPEHLEVALNERMKKLSLLWNQNREDLKLIRKIAGAHRDHDAILMFDTIEDLDVFDIMEVGSHVGRILNELGEPSQKIITYTSSIDPEGRKFA